MVDAVVGSDTRIGRSLAISGGPPPPKSVNFCELSVPKRRRRAGNIPASEGLADYVGVFKKETVGSSDLDPPGSRSVTIRCGIVAEMHELFLVAFGDAHQHHEKCQAIPGPPAEPADPPLAEARVDRDWSFQAQESGFEAHACDIHGSGAAHSQGIGRTKPPSK